MFALTDKDNDLSLPLSSRDPLGTQTVWQRRARDIVPTLTAASRFAEGFHILLVALAWWPEIAGRQDAPKLKLKEFFVLVEQAFARASRCAGIDWVLPGSRRLNDGEPGVWFSLAKDAQLLDNQLTNGVWGLYRGPALNAGLIDDHDRICRGELEVRIRDSSPVIGRLLRPIAELSNETSAKRRELAKNRSHQIVTGLTNILKDLPLKREIRETFVLPAASSITIDLAKLLVHQNRPDIDVGEFVATAIEALPHHAGTLKNVMSCEQFIAPLDAIFQAICSSTERDVERVAAALEMDLAELRIARDRFTVAGNYDGLSRERADALLELDLSCKSSLVVSLIAHHSAVSASRNSAPWITLDESGRLDCSLAAEPPTADRLSPATSWLNGYYLPALQTLAQQVGIRGAR